MKKYQIHERAIKWCESFLSNREQRVVIHGNSSQWAKVTSGVPQGSVLGPLLFVIFVNDLPNAVTSCIQLFADDAKLFRCIRTPEDQAHLQEDLDRMEEWTKTWKMYFNPTKCQVMQIGSRIPEHTYKLCQQDLETTDTIRDLGILVSRNLIFSEYINSQVIKANRILGMIRRTFLRLDYKTFTLLYKALVRPHLEYCHHLTYPCLEKDWKSLENVQRRATKLLAGLRDKPYEERLATLQLPSMHYRLQRGDLIKVFKYLNGLVNIL
jgi:hypothetical protein